jgi:3-hydroxybutyryl-CoA dehydrogenase
VAVARVGVLGAGTMGAGIAQLAVLGGFRTQLYDPDPDALSEGAERIGAGLSKGTERRRWSEEQGEAALARLALAGDLAELGECELVIEAAPERLELKRELFTAAAAACGPHAVFATNTSSLRVSDIAAGVPFPERVVGMHFFNPPALMELVEIVAGERSSEAALSTAREVAEGMGRTPIRARDSPGFLANRLARPFSLESLRMLGDGLAEAAEIDRAVRVGGGFRMGPFELLDLIGLDVNLEIARSFFAQGGEPERWRPSPVQERLVAAGRLGRKSGEGYYAYAPGEQREPDPELGVPAPTLDPESLARIGPAAEPVLRRLFAQIANEAAFALEEEVGSPEDMEIAMRLGFNWPRGPLGIAELVTPAGAVELLGHLGEGHGPAYAAAPLLRLAAERGASLRAVSPGLVS